MLPYHELQIAYAAVACALAAAAWWLSGRFGRPESLLARWVVASALASAASAGFHAVLRPLGPNTSSLFIAVALVFYAAGFWLPGIVLAVALRRKATAVAVLATIPPLVGLYAMLVEPNRLQFRDETVPIAAWAASTPPLLVAHLSDLQTVGPCAREERALEEVARRKPDLIVVTGDYVAGPYFDTWPAEADAHAFLARLCCIAPTIVVAGHSENEETRLRVFEGLDLLYLEDAARTFDFGDGRKLRAIGLDPFKPDLRLPREHRPAGEAQLVVTHTPDVTTQLAGTGIDLHVAGHTHGGQIVVPFFGAPLTLTRLPRKYARGLFWMDDHWLDVCAGLGMEGNHAPRIRLFCPPEISFLRLTGRTRG
jgi:predicted MPP superfamily phosphohydrolase